MASFGPAWSGQWIWCERPPGVPPFAPPGAIPTAACNRFCFFRREFEVDRGAVDDPTVPCRVTADSRFILYVNGVEVRRGPARSTPERLAWCELDLAPHLIDGVNCIAALVRFYGTPVAWWQPAPPAHQIGLGGFILEAPSLGLVTDTSWRAHPAPYRSDSRATFHAPPPEEIDGRAWPAGWNRAGFDASEWSAAVELRAVVPSTGGGGLPVPPFTRPEPDGIAPLTATPVDLRPLNSQVYDARRITLATPWVEVHGPAGAVVEVVVGEDLDAEGAVVTEPRDYHLTYTLGGRGTERVEGFEAVGFRYLGLSAPAGVEVRGAGATERRYPRPGGANFTSDDARLDAIWAIGARTLDVCSTDAFIDCPGREQRAWVGDSYVHALTSYVANPDWRLVRRHLQLCAASQRGDGLLAMAAAGDLALGSLTIPDYSLHWVRSLARYHQHAGDTPTVRRLLPTAIQIVDAFESYRRDDGLLHAIPGWVFVDWAQTERGDVTAAVDALYAAALRDLAWLQSLVLGDEDGAAESLDRAERTATALDALWDNDRGIYVDAIGAGTGRGRRVSQQTNAMAIIGGCAPEGRWDRMLDAILDPRRVVVTATPAEERGVVPWRQQAALPDPTRFDPEVDVVAAQPFFAHFVHQAVALAGRRELIPNLCRRWGAQLDRGNTTFEEYWDAPPGTASRAHAWSSTPTYDLTTHVLGVRPLAPGYARAAIDPVFANLGHLAGRVPTPFGFIEVDLTPSGGRVVIPDGVTAEVTFSDVDLRGGTYDGGEHPIRH